MDRTATLPRDLLDWPLRAAMRGIDVPHWVVVHGVADMNPACTDGPTSTRRCGPAPVRDELLRICLDQSLAAEPPTW